MLIIAERHGAVDLVSGKGGHRLEPPVIENRDATLGCVFREAEAVGAGQWSLGRGVAGEPRERTAGPFQVDWRGSRDGSRSVSRPRFPVPFHSGRFRAGRFFSGKSDIREFLKRN